MTRYGSVLRVKAAWVEKYKEDHKAVWPGVLRRIAECHIRNYSIFLRDGLLFAYFEYHGTDYAADMAAMAADPETQKWWEIMMPMQEPVGTAEPGEWWAPAEEVFHVD